MTQPTERAWWWKVAKHLDDAQLATVNVIATAADDPRIRAFHETLREGQALLLEIFRVKGLLPEAAQPAQAPAPPSPPEVTAEPPVPGALPISFGVPAFAQVPAPPPGWPLPADPPPPPPPPVQVLEGMPVVVEATPVAVEPAAAPASSEVFDYGDDAGKGFENQEVEAKA